MNWREFVESVIVIACGVILLSPEFNTIFNIPFLSFMGHIHHEILSHLAIALVPIIIIYAIDIVRGKTD